MKQWTFHLDLDGVLVDFLAGVCIEFKVDRNHLVGNWVPGEKAIEPALSKTLGRHISGGEFWDRIAATPNGGFWRKLPPCHWCDELIALAEKHGEWFICTSPPSASNSAQGKIDWMQDKWGRRFRRFSIMPHKYLLANPHSILIDDDPDKVEEFRKHNGYAVLVPRHWNQGMAHNGNPTVAVKAAVETIINNF